MIAFQLAVDHPRAVRTLTVVNSGPALVPRTTAERRWIALRLAVARLFGPAGMAVLLAPRLFLRPGQGPLRRRSRERMARNDRRAYAATQRPLIGWSVLDRIGAIEVPALIVAAERDYTPPAAKEAYAGSCYGPRSWSCPTPDTPCPWRSPSNSTGCCSPSSPATRPGTEGNLLHLGTVLGRHARSRSGHLAVAFEDQHLTWREFDAGVNRAANALLGLGLRQGDALALVLPNCLELIDLYWAAAKTGAAFRMRPESVVLRAGSLAFNLVCLAAAINDDADHRVLPGPAFHHDQARRFQGIQGPILGLPIDLKALEDRRRQKDRPRLLAARLEPDRQPNG
jgi:hypothetical protein